MSDKKELLRKAKDKASKAFAEGKMKEALKLFTEVVEGDPTEIGCFMKVGDIHRRLGNHQQAIAAYEPVVRHYAADGLLLKAVAVCKLILTVDASHTSTQEMLADLYSKRSGAPAPKPASAPLVAPARPTRFDPKEGIELSMASSTMEIDRGGGDYATRHAASLPMGAMVDGQGLQVIRGQPTASTASAFGPAPRIEAPVVRGQLEQPPPSTPRVPPPAAITGAWPIAAPRAATPSIEAPLAPSPPPPAWPIPMAAQAASRELGPPPPAWPLPVNPVSGSPDLGTSPPTGSWPVPLPTPEAAAAASPVASGNPADWFLPSSDPAPAPSSEPPPPMRTVQGTPLDARALESMSVTSADLMALDDIDVSEDLEGMEGEPPIELREPKPEPVQESVELLSVPQIPLFSELPRSAFIEILVEMTMREMKAGEAVIREGEIGDSFFVIVAGKVRITRRSGEQDIVLAELSDGAFFGEMAALQDTVRTASVFVQEDSQIFEIKRGLLDRLIREHPSVERVLRNFYMQRLLSTSMATHPVFRPFSADERRDLMQNFRSREFKSGSVLVEEETRGEGLYILLTGGLEVTKMRDEGRVVIAHLAPGDVFGEMSLLLSRPTMASVTAVKDSLILRLSKKDFDQLIMTHPQMLELVAKISEARELENMALFQDFPNQEPTGAALV